MIHLRGQKPSLGLMLVIAYSLVFPTVSAAERFIAYVVEAGTVGNQAYEGSLGMDFEVVNPIIVTRLGVFDDESNGLQRTLTAYLYDRSDPDAPFPLASIEFTPEDPGELIGGSRFKNLPEPIRLETGFLGTIVAENYGEGEQNGNAGSGPEFHVWTLNNGNGSLRFVGGSRFGAQGDYPYTVDGGPEDRYAAGTFEFETTDPVRPGRVEGLAIAPGDRQVVLTWQAVTNPLPAARYDVRRGDSREGPFASVGEATEPTFTNSDLTNGRVGCYQVVAVAEGGQEGEASEILCAAPNVVPAGQNIAYAVQAAIRGGQAFEGVLGMDFHVVNAIVVTHLGVFDDGSDGLYRNITARLWDQTIPDSPVELASLEFTPEAPGELINGSRFLPLPEPIRLEPGFIGTISAENYGLEERVYNPGGNPAVARPWTLNDGNGSIRFIGTGRFSEFQGEFPWNPDGGAPDRYGAGTFQFQTTEIVTPGIVDLTARRGDLSVILSWDPVTAPAPAARYRIFKGQPDGELTQVAEVETTGYTDSGLTEGASYCYSVAAVTAAGVVGPASASACLSVEAREPGIAYQVPAGTVGNQSFDGALGLDFDVIVPVTITRLGVFDDSSDGLFLPISARLYNRATREVIASLEFTPEDEGELIDGSRFKDLPTPVTLPAGFQGTMVASGYGNDERNGNVGTPDLTMFSGGGALEFVGSARFGVDPAGFPDIVDGGPANRYAAGTFYFEPGAELPTLSFSRTDTGFTISWSGQGVLESATDLAGPWTAVDGATSGYAVQPTGTATFYRLRQ